MRPKGGWLTATRGTPGQLVRLANQRLQQVREGEWLVADGGVAIELCPEGELRKKYDLQEASALRISPAGRQRLETLLGTGSTESEAQLLAKVERLARLQLGTLSIPLSPAQAEEVARRALRNNQSPQQAMQAVLDRVQEELFPRTSGAVGG